MGRRIHNRFCLAGAHDTGRGAAGKSDSVFRVAWRLNCRWCLLPASTGSLHTACPMQLSPLSDFHSFRAGIQRAKALRTSRRLGQTQGAQGGRDTKPILETIILTALPACLGGAQRANCVLANSGAQPQRGTHLSPTRLSRSLPDGSAGGRHSSRARLGPHDVRIPNSLSRKHLETALPG